MSEEYIAYNVCRIRNKNKYGKDNQTVRKELIIRKQNHCDKCHEKFRDTLLELDHIIPISVGGDIFNENNFQLLCYKCHKEKTYADNSTVALLKRLGFIQSKNIFFKNPKEIIDLFKQLRPLVEEGREYTKAYRDWNYKTFVYEDNRGRNNAN